MVVPPFHKTSDVSTFKIFSKFVAVNGKCEHHTSHVTFFTVNHMHSNMGPHSHYHIHLQRLHFFCPSSSPSLLSPCPSYCPTTSSSTMWWTNSFCTSADEDLDTLAEHDPLTQFLRIINLFFVQTFQNSSSGTFVMERSSSHLVSKPCTLSFFRQVVEVNESFACSA